MDKISQAPSFFKNAPLVLDLKNLSVNQESFSLVKIYKLLRDKNLIPVGIKNAMFSKTSRGAETAELISPQL